MKVRTFLDEGAASTLPELHSLLNARHQVHFGSFWLYHQTGAEMGVMIKDGDAYIHYFPGDGSAGFRPVGAEPDNWKHAVEFLADNYEPTPIPKAMIVPLQEAQAAIEEFFLAGALPKALRWEEL